MKKYLVEGYTESGLGLGKPFEIIIEDIDFPLSEGDTLTIKKEVR